MKKEIVILTDNKGFVWGKHIGTAKNNTLASADVLKIQEELVSKGYAVNVFSYGAVPIDFEWKGKYVFYASSERRGGFYKNYIEDILLEIQMNGGILVPKFIYFRAHENKCFAEILRRNFQRDVLKFPTSRVYGCYEDLLKDMEQITYPCVVKSASGSGSKGVCLAHNAKELEQCVKRVSKHSYFNYQYTYKQRFFEFGIGYWLKRLYHSLRGVKGHYQLKKDYTNKFIIQDYIADLKGDYKILFWGGKFYALYRENRVNDFRASGSGRFSFPKLTDELRRALNLAKECVDEIKMPMISMDIAISDKGCYLIEFQCVCFGAYTMEFSEQYYRYDQENKRWDAVMEEPDLEREIANSLDWYIKRAEG